jgi:hypothetical protein
LANRKKLLTFAVPKRGNEKKRSERIAGQMKTASLAHQPNGEIDIKGKP